MSDTQGKILKGIGGFYYVNVADTVYECKARGLFRKDGKKPLVGDDVRMEILDEEKRIGNVTELLPRRSELLRPAVANVDQALIIFAMASPDPTLNLLDRFLVMMEQNSLPTIVLFNKEDLGSPEYCRHLVEVYRGAGYETLPVSCATGEGVDAVRALLQGRTTTVAGPSGVGKSSLINRLLGDLVMETGAVSEKIDRGRHTTRHSQLLRIAEDTYIMDTPGFSSLEVRGIEKEDLWNYYPEFRPFEPRCRFAQCSHLHEPQCAVRAAVESGEISEERYGNYGLLYREIESRKKY